MKNVYLLNNSYSLPIRERRIDEYLPLTIRTEDPYSHDYKYLRFGRAEIVIDYINMQFLRLAIRGAMGYAPLHFVSGLLSVACYPQKQMSIYLTIDTDLSNYGFTGKGSVMYEINIEDCSTLDVFENAIIAKLPQGKDPCFYIHESDILGLLVDIDFNVTAFVTWNLTNKEMNTLRGGDSYKELPQVPRRCTIENEGILLQKILELKNVNYFNILYYGFCKQIIDLQLLAKFAQLLDSHQQEHNYKMLIKELAQLNRDDEALTLLEKLITNKDEILSVENQLYNDIWFYLLLAADIKALNIID